MRIMKVKYYQLIDGTHLKLMEKNMLIHPNSKSQNFSNYKA